MALEKCAAQVAANIAMSCENPIVPGFEEVGILINRQDIVEMPYVTTNARMKTAIQLKPSAKVSAIYNPFTTPFGDTGVEANMEGLLPGWNKTVNFGVPAVGADNSMKVLEPILKNRSGFVVILERKNKVGDGTFLIIGSEKGAIAPSQTANFTDVATNGMYQCVLTEEKANFAEVTLFDTNYETSKAEFERLLALCY